ncbi:allophanate hydrolase-related protein [Streptosporangium sp. NBC_01756]|uniref:allophanate hydrolase-related protein n=1 Tax=Streptosporangium sp. NBC_01756 TaxID=2975950 RepID=UPI002DDA645E|nr:gamma-glutamylcyclotransferase [Streptosporangium sp. NBC_01756]WSC84633.1 gamma-glutamylcyclotransferase [Streptosporangium sp. NBC_01756]
MESLRMFVNGQAMSGGSLNTALSGARFVGPAETAPRYRFYSVRDEFPGLYQVTSDGHAVPGELYEVTYEILREHLLPNEPEELELSVIELADGSGSLSMRMRDESLTLPGVTDISTAGGWRAYLAGASVQPEDTAR